ncbi:MAG: ferritin family protein [Deltaproteobacteria bacterium]|nr:ferritin family protein [Deltaproteobacteria bacterium]MBW2306352.1 ferritin family protein [Deltaproteobacteria bacterium]
MVSSAGIKDAHSMEGGIKAWSGDVATGAPEAGMSIFSQADRAEDLVALAWVLEEGSRRFYAGVAEMLDDTQGTNMFNDLVAAEEHHKESLVRVYKELAGSGSEPGLPNTIASDELAGDLMEGGIRVGEALAWAKGKGAVELLDLSMSLEINAYDLYVKMARRMENEDVGKVLKNIAEEERKHLERLGDLLEKRI